MVGRGGSFAEAMIVSTDSYVAPGTENPYTYQQVLNLSRVEYLCSSTHLPVLDNPDTVLVTFTVPGVPGAWS